MNLENICIQSIDLTKKVGSFIKRQSYSINDKSLRMKAHNHIVTEIDEEAERMLVEGLSKILPEAGFLTEEGTVEQSDKEYQWIIDPIDGTTNFVYNLPCYSVSVALKKDDEIIIGIVYEINQKECFYSWLGEKAYMNGKVISVSNTSRIEDSLLATGLPYFDFELMQQYMACLQELLKRSRGMRRFGSAAVDLAYVACGRFDGFFEYALSPWDIAAGAFILEQAGGKVSDFSGNDEYLFGKELVACNTKMYDEFIDVIKNAFQPSYV